MDENDKKFVKTNRKEIEPILPEGPTPDTKADQISFAKKLQGKLLRYFDNMLDRGLMTPTDAATLGRLLAQNGWSFDETSLPQNLRSKLTKVIDPATLDEMLNDGRAD